MTDFRDFESSTSFAAENSSDSSQKREMTPFQKGVCAVAAVGLAGTAVGLGLYWGNRGIKATADNIAAAADGIKAAHDRHEEKKAQKKAIEDAVNQG